MRNAHGSPAIHSLVGSLCETYRHGTFPSPPKGRCTCVSQSTFIARCRLALAGLLVAVPGARAADPVFTEFIGGVTPGLSADGGPAGIALGPDGNVWMAETQGPGRITKVTPAGVVTEFTGGVTPNLTAGQQPANVSAGPDGNVWVTQFSTGGIVRITPAGAVTEYPRAVTGNNNPVGITAGPDGNLWFVDFAHPGRIVKMTTAGAMQTMASGGDSSGLSANRFPRGITLGPDGNLWFTEFAVPGRIGRITPAGVVTEFPLGGPSTFSPNRQPVGITTGPDGNLWFTEQGDGGRIGRITPAGVVTEFDLPPGRVPALITSGPDGALWFTEQASPGGIGRITTAGVVTEYLAGSTPGFTADRIAERDHGRCRRQPVVHRDRRSGGGRAHRPWARRARADPGEARPARVPPRPPHLGPAQGQWCRNSRGSPRWPPACRWWRAPPRC